MSQYIGFQIATWTSENTWIYAVQRDSLYNPLHDQGYPSIGDEPAIASVRKGEDERAGRQRGRDRTECRIH